MLNIGFLIGHGEVLAHKNNKVTLTNKLDQWGIPIPHIDCKWHDNEIIENHETIGILIILIGVFVMNYKKLE